MAKDRCIGININFVPVSLCCCSHDRCNVGGNPVYGSVHDIPLRILYLWITVTQNDSSSGGMGGGSNYGGGGNGGGFGGYGQSLLFSCLIVFLYQIMLISEISDISQVVVVEEAQTE